MGIFLLVFNNLRKYFWRDKVTKCYDFDFDYVSRHGESRHHGAGNYNEAECGGILPLTRAAMPSWLVGL